MNRRRVGWRRVRGISIAVALAMNACGTSHVRGESAAAHWTEIEAADNYTCVTNAAGDDLVCWGRMFEISEVLGARIDASLSALDLVPRALPAVGPSIRMTAWHTCSAERDALACRCGREVAPVPFLEASSLRGVTTNTGIACAVTETGARCIWGSTIETTREIVLPATAVGARVASAGPFSSGCYSTGTREVECWDRTPDERPYRRRVIPLATDIVALVGDARAGCFLDATRSLYCWSAVDEEPARMDLPPVVRVEQRLGQMVALGADGNAYYWGRYNGCDALESTSFTDFPVEPNDCSAESIPAPTRLEGVTDVIDIAVGALHWCALLSDGRALCWGSNRVGQLGDGTRIDSLTPVRVALPR